MNVSQRADSYRTAAILIISSVFITYLTFVQLNLSGVIVGDFWAHPLADPMFSFAVYSSGFEPLLGGIVIGLMADLANRKSTLIVAVATIGVLSIAQAITPSYNSIGHEATVLYIVLLHARSFAWGGSIGLIVILLFEASPPNKVGLYTSCVVASQSAASLFAQFVYFAFARPLSGGITPDWSWRYALLPSVLTIPVVMLLASLVLETPRQEISATKARSNFRLALVGFSGFLALRILDTQENILALDMLSKNLTTKSAFVFSIPLQSACGVLFALVSGWLYDRLGRKPVMIVSGVMLFALTTIVGASELRLMAVGRWSGGLLLISLTSAIFGAFFETQVFIALAESFSATNRARGVGIVYGAVAAAFTLVVGRSGRILTNGDLLLFGLICICGFLSPVLLRTKEKAIFSSKASSC